MRRLHPGFLQGLAGSTLVSVAAFFVWFQWLVARSAVERGEVGGLALLLAGLPGLLLIAAVGRTVLAVLPPGPLGAHDRGGILTTWAASHLLGSLVLALQMVVFPPRPGLGYVALLLVPWIVLGAGRLLTLPGAMVPRHAPPVEEPERVARGLRLVFVLVALSIPLGTVAVFGGDAEWLDQPRFAPAFDPEGALPEPDPHPFPVPRRAHLLPSNPEIILSLTTAPALRAAAWRMFVPFSAVALLVLMAHGLAQARRAPAGRWAVLLGLGLVLGPFAVSNCAFAGEVFLRALGLGAGVALGFVWLRRADRRALFLACAGFLCCALAGGIALALAGAVGLVAATAGPSRRRALGVVVGSTLLGAASLALAVARDDRVRIGWGQHPADGWNGRFEIPYWLVAPAVGAALLWFVVAVLLRRGERVAAPGAAGEPGREWVAVGVLLVFGAAAWPWLDGSFYDLPTTLSPVVAAFTALALVRSERPGG